MVTYIHDRHLIPRSCIYYYISTPDVFNSGLTSVYILWNLWLREDNLDILCRAETYIEGYARDFCKCRLANNLCRPNLSRNSHRLVHTHNYRTGQRKLHIYSRRLSRWVQHGNCHIAIHRLESIKIHFVPFILICCQVNALSNIQQLSTMARIVGIIDHIYTHSYRSVGGQLNIYLGYLVIYHLIHQVKQLLWNNHSVVPTTWKFYDGLSCNIILTTYGSTHSDSGQALL